MSLLNTLKFITNHPLNQQRKIRAMTEFVKWQLGSRLVPGKVIFNWVNGSRLIVEPRETGVTGNIYCGLHEFADMAYLLHFLTPEDLFIDVGANVGSYTILACAAKGAKGYCFEPVPATYQRLMDNIRLNGLTDRVVALNIGLADKESQLIFTSDENCTNHVVTDNETSANVIKVKVQSLDSVLSGKSPSLMKIDVEGFETRVIDGAHDILAQPSLLSVLMELNGSGLRYGFDEDSILGRMKDFGFSTYEYEPFARELRPLHGKNSSSGNTLFIRNEDLVQARIAKAPRMLVGTRQL